MGIDRNCINFYLALSDDILEAGWRNFTQPFICTYFYPIQFVFWTEM